MKSTVPYDVYDRMVRGLERERDAAVAGKVVLREALEEVRSVLDLAGGDTDLPSDPEEWKEQAPIPWACYKISSLIADTTDAEREMPAKVRAWDRMYEDVKTRNIRGSVRDCMTDKLAEELSK